MNLKIKITFDYDEKLYYVFVDEIKELYGEGETEEKAFLDFLIRYENDFSGHKCFNIQSVQNKILQLNKQ
ncbi:hypothetical protein GW796_06000 [archaeon]|nr:hypothetical protein [archaeon]NCQ51437.1 hypothetical protein [archaeon]NCT58737.1 hypothetical protein [archaeon]